MMSSVATRLRSPPREEPLWPHLQNWGSPGTGLWCHLGGSGVQAHAQSTSAYKQEIEGTSQQGRTPCKGLGQAMPQAPGLDSGSLMPSPAVWSCWAMPGYTLFPTRTCLPIYTHFHMGMPMEHTHMGVYSPILWVPACAYPYVHMHPTCAHSVHGAFMCAHMHPCTDTFMFAHILADRCLPKLHISATYTALEYSNMSVPTQAYTFRLMCTCEHVRT